MPPATRRDVRLSASLPDPSAQYGSSGQLEPSKSSSLLMPNMESILENFEQFKRKHISQNREIIKTNALAQIRIRELENRIHTLESEKAQQAMSTLGLRAQLNRLHHAMGLVRLGWDAIGKGLGIGTSSSSPSSLHHMADFHVDSKDPCLFSTLSSSQRVSVQPSPNAVGIVRSVAKPPEGHIARLIEEEDEGAPSQSKQVIFSPSQQARQQDHLTVWQNDLDQLRSSTSYGVSEPERDRLPSPSFDIEGAPSPMGSPDLEMDLETAIAAASRSRNLQSSSRASSSNLILSAEELTQAQEDSRRFLRRSGRRSNRRQSGLVAHPVFEDGSDPAEPCHSDSHMIAASAIRSSPLPDFDMDDASSLPSEANSEMMEGILVYPGDSARYSAAVLSENANITNLTQQTNSPQNLVEPTPRKPRRPTLQPSLTAKKASIEDLASQEPVTPGGRKRKISAQEPHEPMPTPARLFVSLDTTTPAKARDPNDEEPQTGRARRVRKSINYTLPKLNTKMRKPDPSDLVPAPTPRRSSTGTTPSSRSMVGSSGNLSDIRKQHQLSASRWSPAERSAQSRANGSPPMTAAPAGSEGEGGLPSDVNQSYWGQDPLMDTSDDDSRATSNADLSELAELEGAMSDLSTADEGHQILTPRPRQTSSSLSAQMTTSSSSDSMYSSRSGDLEDGNKRPSLRRKTTTLPSRSRQSSAEQPLNGLKDRDTSTDSEARNPRAEGEDQKQSPREDSKIAADTSGGDKANPSALVSKSDDTKPSRAGLTHHTTSTSVKTLSSGLAAGMKPKQRPASADANLSHSRSATASLTTAIAATERPNTFSGATAASAGISTTASPRVASSRSAGATSSQRISLHSALTSQARVGQGTPRLGTKGLPASLATSARASPKLTSTPILRPTLSTSSLNTTSSGCSSPALSAASTTSSGSQLTTITRSSLPASSSSTSQHSKTRSNPGSNPSTNNKVAAVSSTLTPNTVGPASESRPHPAKSMPSLRKTGDRPGVTSTPRITVRSASATHSATLGDKSLPIVKTAISRSSDDSGSIARKGISDAVTVSMGLGIDFSSVVGSADILQVDKGLLDLTEEINHVLQTSPLAAQSIHPTDVEAHIPGSSSIGDDQHNFEPQRPRRTSRRVSGMST